MNSMIDIRRYIERARLRRPAGLLPLLAALLFAGAAEAGHPAGEGGRINVTIFNDIGGFDHLEAPHAGLSRLQVLFAVHDRLFEPDAGTGKPVPRLALKAVPRDDFTNWRVSLRPGVNFSNGEKLTADAYQRHFERLLKSEYAMRFRALAGAPLRKVTASGKLTIDFQFSKPNPGFRAAMSHGGAYIWFLNAPNLMTRNRAHPGLSGMIAGAGPYRIAAWEPGKRVVLKRNPGYWDPAAQHADEIYYHILAGSNPEDLLQRLRGGQLDAAAVIADSVIRAARKQRDLRVFRSVRDHFGLAVGFNQQFAPLGDQVARLALVQAIDRRAIARALGGGNADIADQLFAGARWRCADVGYPAHDPGGARNILEALGADFSQLQIWADDTPPMRRAAEMIQDMWRAVGVPTGVHLVTAAERSLTYQIVTGRAAVWIWQQGPFVHPSFSDLSLRSASRQNISRLRSAKIDAAIAGLARARSKKDIGAAHCAFEAVKSELVPYLPVMRGVLGMITRKDIGGVRLTGDPVLGYHRLFRK